MIAQMAKSNEPGFGNLMSDHLDLALQSHRDANSITIQDLDYNILKDFVLFPNFIYNFESFVHKLVLEQKVESNVKLRYLAFLTSTTSKDDEAIKESIKYCFNLLLFVRAEASSIEHFEAKNFPDVLELPIFDVVEDEFLKAIQILLKY